MSAYRRFEGLSVVVFGATLSATLFVKENVDLDAFLGPYAPVVLVVLGLLSYDALYKATLSAIKRSTLLKKIYWGHLYLEGLWEYSSHEGGREFIGVWRIEQDAFRTSVIAFGLDDAFRRRSTVQSVSDLLGADGVFEIINRRWDLTEGSRVQFSRTTLVPDRPVRHGLFSYPDVIRGETIIYGGSIDGLINHDLKMHRRDQHGSEEGLIGEMRERRRLRPAPGSPNAPGAAAAAVLSGQQPAQDRNNAPSHADSAL